MARAPFGEPHLLLNVAREASLDEIEAAFAQRYRAARRAGDEPARQALNTALERLRDPEARAVAEVEGYHLPLDPAARLPELPELVEALLPRPAPESDPLRALPVPRAAELVGEWLEAEPPEPWPDDRRLLRQLAARLAIERIDPWEKDR